MGPPAKLCYTEAGQGLLQSVRKSTASRVGRAGMLLKPSPLGVHLGVFHQVRLEHMCPCAFKRIRLGIRQYGCVVNRGCPWDYSRAPVLP